MIICGGLSGFLELTKYGVKSGIMLNFQAGIGFTGIAVSLIGRNHPLGILWQPSFRNTLPGRGGAFI
ncbi:MAG: hypothetical protein Ct9H300mP28_04850 [Pseudomonadota bacterium]|nr:MAG: hypothetical protein Ct9H300mP28_04850 [Pseudomonadota bacterium]